MKTLIFILISFGFINAQVIDYTYKNSGSELSYKLLHDGMNNYEWRMMKNALGDAIKINDKSRFFVTKDNTHYFIDKTALKNLTIQDNPTFSWKLEKGTKNILGYNCLEASVKFRGREYIAYYAPDIKINAGPWKFSGLDGLILYVESKDKNYIFEATSINLDRKEFNKNNFDIINRNNFIDWNLYKEKYLEDIQVYLNNQQCNCPDDGMNIYRLSKIEKIHPTLHDQGIVY